MRLGQSILSLKGVVKCPTLEHHQVVGELVGCFEPEVRIR